MRYVVVRRVTVLLGVAIVLCAAAFAWIVRDGTPRPVEEAAAPGARGASAEGAMLFERHCSSCHEAGDLQEELRSGTAGLRARWEALLQKHGKASNEEDRLILEYLAATRVR